MFLGGYFNSKYIEMNNYMRVFKKIKKFLDDKLWTVLVEERHQKTMKFACKIMDDKEEGIYSNKTDKKIRLELGKSQMTLFEFYMPIDAAVSYLITKKEKYLLYLFILPSIGFFIHFLCYRYVKRHTIIVNINLNGSDKGYAKIGKKKYNLSELRFKAKKGNFGKSDILKAYRKKCGIKVSTFKLISNEFDGTFYELAGKLNSLGLIDNAAYMVKFAEDGWRD